MSTKIKKVLSFLEGKYPISGAEKWDKPGLLLGSKDKDIEKIIVALDLTLEVFDEAIKQRADLIITHHPFIWEETLEAEFKLNPWKKEIHTRIINTGISVYSIHTNYDASKDGMSVQLAKLFNVKPRYVRGSKYGFYFEELMTLDAIERRLKETLNVDIVQTNKKGTDVNNKIAFIPGSAALEDILEFHKNGVDLIITSDIKWATWICAKEMGIALASVSHSIEDVFTKHINNQLAKEFENIDVVSVFATEFEI